MTDPTRLTATALAVALRRGGREPTAVLEAFLDRIDARNDELNAYMTVTKELAREQAADAERKLTASVSAGPLCGVPVAIKDLDHLKTGVRHTFGSKAIDEYGFKPDRTAVVVERLEAAGAVILGKTNVPELGHKGTTDNDILGETVSPFDLSLNAGGSSGGSGAAVGAGLAPIALGSDAGGSIRIPAACCGVVGFKPSFGLVPTDSRPNAFGSQLHHTTTGPLARTVDDVALVMNVLAGPHPRDPASVPVDIPYREPRIDAETELRVAFSPTLDVFPVEPAVEQMARDAARALEAAGMTVEEIEIGHGLDLETLKAAVTTTFCGSMVGVAQDIETAFGIDLRSHEAVSETLQRMLEIGDGLTAADIAATGPVRTTVFDAIQAILSEYDLLATPTLTTAGIKSELGATEWERALTWPFNWTGHPVLSVPAGVAGGHPVGLQLVGRLYADDTVLAGGRALEAERPWAWLYDYSSLEDRPVRFR